LSYFFNSLFILFQSKAVKVKPKARSKSQKKAEAKEKLLFPKDPLGTYIINHFVDGDWRDMFVGPKGGFFYRNELGNKEYLKADKLFDELER
jgi:hypothetical protein